MADIKATRVDYFLSLESSEFNMVFRAVGQACGAKARFKRSEIEALRKLNAKLAEIRVATARQTLLQAEAALTSAIEISGLPVPEDSPVEEG